MKLIGAGLPRTGTLTQKVALEMVGLGPCYHMVNVLANLDLVSVWRGALEGNADWDEVFEGFPSNVDWPSSFYFEQLADQYPDAKVLLSVREPEAWQKSMRETILDLLIGDSLLHHLSCATERLNPQWQAFTDLMKDMWVKQGVLGDDRHTEQDLVEVFNRHTETVKKAIPEERLLVWTAADGWDPLCAFLGVEVPEAPFPHLNDGKTFVDRLYEMSVTTISGWWERERPAE